MGWLVVPVVLVIVLALWIAASGRTYKKVFADEHFREVADKLPALKQAALNNPITTDDEAVPPADDPRTFVTSAGLAVLYSVDPREGAYLHRFSVSLASRGYTAHAVGDQFISYIARLLGLPKDQLGLAISPRSVHYGAFSVSRDEHEKYAARPVGAFSPDDLEAFRQDWRKSRNTVRWERLRI